MELIAKERDRLMRRTARLIGLAGTTVSVIGISIPGVVSPLTFFLCVPLYALLIFGQIMVGRSVERRWVALGFAAGLAILVVLRFSPPDVLDGSSTGTAGVMAPLAATALASFALALPTTVAWSAVLLVVAVSSFFLVQNAAGIGGGLTQTTLSVILGWTLIVLVRYWLVSAVPRVSRRIYSIGKAHRAERVASETEAQRRQSARLMHDTVLATLTMLAHSGVGVAPAVLQQQAAEDARLLRQLRLGANPTPESSGSYSLQSPSAPVLGTTLESVKSRFGRMGLEVSWHGSGQVLLPGTVLDAFLLALAECLENVRRHSGILQADVTITDDATTVRAMVTDAGVGFDPGTIGDDKLGIKESIVARLHEVNGNARLFSSPGSGTTVVLEVPK
ncbi:MAG: histidine kinase [Glaciihabitans sp.]